jgi:hypothetical protein
VPSRIPRLDTIREIVRAQEPVDDPSPRRLAGASRAALVVQAIREFDAMAARGHPPGVIVQILRQRAYHEPDIIDALQAAVPASGTTTTRRVDPAALKAGDILAADLRAANGTLLLSGGQVLTEPMLVRIQNFESMPGLGERPLIASAS